MLRHTCLIWLISILAGGNMTACKSTKQTSSKQIERESVIDSALLINTNEVLTTDYFDDEISGFVPLDFTRLQDLDSLVIPVKSKGVEMEMVVKPSGISYHTKVKPVARSKLQKKEERTQSSQTQVKEESKEKEKVKTKPSGFRLPWWMWVALVIAAIILVLRLLKVIQNPLKLF